MGAMYGTTNTRLFPKAKNPPNALQGPVPGIGKAPDEI